MVITLDPTLLSLQLLPHGPKYCLSESQWESQLPILALISLVFGVFITWFSCSVQKLLSTVSILFPFIEGF
jgi:hypothetical protein